MNIDALLIRPKNHPYTLSLLFSIGGRYIEADLRPDAVRFLSDHFEIENTEQQAPDAPETYHIVNLKPKGDADQKK